MIDNSMEAIRKIYTQMYQEKCKNYPTMEESSDLPKVRRIIAVGDLHGDLKETIKILELAKVITYNTNKNKAKWIGGDTVVVQVGDQIDRCRSLPCVQMSESEDENSDIKILKLLTELHSQAIKVGGAFYSLVGNHELMNVTGRMDYVSPANYLDFQNKPENQEFLIGNNQTDMEARAWGFKPGNPISEFLACTRRLVLKIGSTLFVHAGIVPEIAKKYNNLNDLNKILAIYLWGGLKNPEVFQDVLGSDVVKGQTIINRDQVCNDKSCFEISPLWNREIGYLDDDEIKCNRIFDAILKSYGAQRMVVGHTPQVIEGINSICGERLIFVDYAASSAFNRSDIKYSKTGERSSSRKTQVLEILNDKEINILKTNTGNKESMNSLVKPKRKNRKTSR